MMSIFKFRIENVKNDLIVTKRNNNMFEVFVKGRTYYKVMDPKIMKWISECTTKIDPTKTI